MVSIEELEFEVEQLIFGGPLFIPCFQNINNINNNNNNFQNNNNLKWTVAKPRSDSNLVHKIIISLYVNQV